MAAAASSIGAHCAANNNAKQHVDLIDNAPAHAHARRSLLWAGQFQFKLMICCLLLGGNTLRHFVASNEANENVSDIDM